LNRVTGGSVSSLNGLLSATGSVYLINPNGVIIGKTGVVNTGGSFVASTLDVSNSSFLAGGALSFTGASTASVVNLGKVGALGGNIALIATTVSNSGALTASNGTVGLAAGSAVTLADSANDDGGLLSVQLGGPTTSVTTSGLIQAAAVELRAQQGNIFALAGNAGDGIDATGVDARGGRIWLVSQDGTASVAGTLDA
jgi:large exoprotein involved in heme utilization and adhesion